MRTLAIDPGPTHSAYIVVNDDLEPLWFDKTTNEELLELRHLQTADHIAIEQIGHYGTGMPAGKDVFDTCIWIGRFWQAILDYDFHAELADGGLLRDPPPSVTLIPRKTVVTYLCGNPKAGDPNITQALIDRFNPGGRNHGKGIKNDPEWFFGFHSDIWSAYALAVYFHDTHKQAT
jgi:hypothetical protein